MRLNELDREGRFTHSTASDHDELVFSQELSLLVRIRYQEDCQNVQRGTQLTALGRRVTMARGALMGRGESTRGGTGGRERATPLPIIAMPTEWVSRRDVPWTSRRSLETGLASSEGERKHHLQLLT